MSSGIVLEPEQTELLIRMVADVLPLGREEQEFWLTVWKGDNKSEADLYLANTKCDYSVTESDIDALVEAELLRKKPIEKDTWSVTVTPLGGAYCDLLSNPTGGQEKPGSIGFIRETEN